MARVVIFSNQSSTWGIAQDAKYVEQVLRECHATRGFPIRSIDHHDPVSFANPNPVDIQIHLEVPCRLAWHWARVNIVVVNPERWPSTAWNWCLAAADLVVFKSPAAAAEFPEVPTERRMVLPWRCRSDSVLSAASTSSVAKKNKVLYLLGGSHNKAAAAKQVVRGWKAEWPTLEVHGAKDLVAEVRASVGDAASTNITWNDAYLSEADKIRLQQEARFHCAASAAEGFGYTMAECAAAGSLPLWTDLPVYRATWGSVLGATGCITTTEVASRLLATGDAQISFSERDVEGEAAVYREARRTFSSAALEAAMASLLSLNPAEALKLQQALQQRCRSISTEWRNSWKVLLKRVGKQLAKKEQPLVLRRQNKADLPVVAIITVTRDRPRWFANMTRNVLGQDYPSEKLRWVIVDDGKADGRVDQEVLKFQQKAPQIDVTYISLPKALTVGEKRNRGCQAGAAKGAEVFVMMDDDDHYPRSSVEARVTYMRSLASSKAPVSCVYCARIPMYDCRRYISAMNVSPMDLSPAERVAEASLAFTRDFWSAKGFPSVSVAEGEDFLAGREAATAEIPPEGILVSFLHGGNSTSRRVPQASEANGCHYGFDDEFFLYLCEMGEAKP